MACTEIQVAVRNEVNVSIRDRNIWSLQDMARWFPAGAIFAFANDLSSYVTQLSEPLFKDQKPDDGWSPCVGEIIKNAKHISKFLDRKNIEIQADRVHGCLTSGTREELKNALTELSQCCPN